MTREQEDALRFSTGTEYAGWVRAGIEDGSLRAMREEDRVVCWTTDEHGRAHHATGPALVSFSGPGKVACVEYRRSGKLHRLDGPAREVAMPDGSRFVEYQKRGEPHREEGPALMRISAEGRVMAAHFMKDGRYVEGDKPNYVIFHENGNVHQAMTKVGCLERGYPHRSDGLALVACHPDGSLAGGAFVHARKRERVELTYNGVQWDQKGHRVSGRPELEEQVRRAAPDMLTAARERAHECKPYRNAKELHGAETILVTKCWRTADLAREVTGHPVALLRHDASLKDAAETLRREHPRANLIGLAGVREEAEFRSVGIASVAPSKALLLDHETTYADLAARTSASFVQDELQRQGVNVRQQEQGRKVGLRA